MAALTPRQKQIKALLDQDKSPAEIAKRLRITRNAVYQQKRRIEAGGGTSPRSSGRRQSSRSARRATAHQRPTPPATVREPVEQPAPDPLAATKERLAQVKIEHRDAERQRDEAIKTLGSLDAEVKRLEQAEAVLSGKTTASKASQAKARSSRQRPAERANGATTQGDGKPEAVSRPEAAETRGEPTAESAASEERAEAAASTS